MRTLLSILILFVSLSLSLSCRNSSDVEPESKSSLIPSNDFNFETFDCDDCTYIVTDYKTDGKELNIEPGDIICLDSKVAYDRLLFSNINGTEANPVIIRNCNGQAIIQATKPGGISFEYSSHFKLLGDGGGSNYGIKVTTNTGFYVLMRTFSNQFEIAHLEVAGNNDGFAGIGLKTSPYEDCELFEDPARPWTMTDIIIRNNYVHNVNGEGLYIGHGFHAGWTGNSCPNVVYPHVIKRLKVFSNIIENTGYDGMQIKNGDEDIEIYDNYIFNYGTRAENGQNEGVLIGGPMTGLFYNNVIIKGTGNGLRMLNIGGNNDVYNNIIMESGKSGIRVDGGNEFDLIFDNPYLNFFNNHIINSGEYGFVIFDKRDAVRRFKNNLVINASDQLIAIGSQIDAIDTSHNIATQDLNFVKFKNLDSYEFELLPDSPGIDAGTNVSNFGVDIDIMRRPRPSGASFDVGAFENQ
ncbi:right-handed parallel beta-helix repeat-containing protein [Marivirga harenae]|uniref:right-handed parallel beta-helix repeat-containing protein n=1 Tax=Marivirga harenae TaxID=2010992 RepID=UPI0026E10504|nr:right-handed parallel beta-helix repeat-containing protein [Marivirga harenae]WKV11232.1 right-handed parallel beta-helix repeat-containing protein [Marivirga harenae]|tara:strand:+ start:114058 stop:115455 length:1398 start_codon:yes stop_codon:yes gene_type:complete